ncbi:DegV family protein [Evansella cellulosilytica]|uniref:DegV family protein n=1 Tax=Evansella cellulosilytica (strain ATCC 21833 / DSM 2522 / FERM P-1141 / JCM 9156 / N-4) TaxID=649639 RepID=E6U086_EVAC2|nr:DegV family protein [Evansella cellulosilytica]ADU30202.1 degV family protein [Evansella cellulosilytica DSM 2522]
MNKKVKIVTDSTVDLPKEELEKLNATIVPLSVTINGKSYVDGVDISSKEFVQLLVKSEEIPQSSQPSVGSFLEVYDELGSDGSQIISIHMTSGMSGTYTSAKTAADMSSSDVTVVDSKYISSALSFQVKEACALAESGATATEILERIEKVKNNTSLYIMVDTLEYLVKGGRIGRGKALVGSLLKIKPVASLQDGVYTPISKVRTYVQLIKFLKNKFEEETAGKIVKGIGIAQVEAKELAQQLKAALKEKTDFNDITIVDTTPIISTHTGPGAVALMYYTDDKLT